MSYVDAPESPEALAFELGHTQAPTDECEDCGELVADHEHRVVPWGVDLACPV